MTGYRELHEGIIGIRDKLNTCEKKIGEIGPEEARRYENPQYRMWSGSIKDLEEFVSRLEEWLSQPHVAEAKRYLKELKNWSNSPEISSMKEIENDWRFLSAYVEEIKNIHYQIKGIEYQNIKGNVSVWVIERIIEKDVGRAKKWATNANKFVQELKQFENKKVESSLAEAVKKDAVDELLRVTSFDSDNKDDINWYRGLIDKAETAVKSKPQEIDVEVIVTTYRMKMQNVGVEKALSEVGEAIEGIRGYLINLEWVVEFPYFSDYNTIWESKQNAIKKDDLDGISKALSAVNEQANKWKEAKKKEIESVLSKSERMVRSIDSSLRDEFTSLRTQLQDVDWDKPDLNSLYDISSKIYELRNNLRDELTKKLQNEDVITIIEEPEVVTDLGHSREWDFDRFFRALEVALKNGIIDIKVEEE